VPAQLVRERPANYQAAALKRRKRQELADAGGGISQVIALRIAKLMRGGKLAEREAQRMITEKWWRRQRLTPT